MPTPADDHEGLSQADVLEAELKNINDLPEGPKGLSDEERLQKIFKTIHELPKKRSALCLSGGGIRSATFCLGVLQGLARRNLLDKFDYLSTVSGGGYIGSWLTAWMHRDGTKKVISALRDNPTSKIKPEPPQISHLRSYSNYLSPKTGGFSVDTWTLVAIYLRNLFLNWLVFIPFLLAVLMIPRFYVWCIRQTPQGSWFWVPLVIGLLLGSLALAYIGSHRPSLRKGRHRSNKQAGKTKEPGLSQSTDPANNLTNFIRCCLVPLVLSALLLTIGRAWFLNRGEFGKLWKFVVFGTVLHFIAWGIYARHLKGWVPRFSELLVVLLTGALAGVFLWLVLIPAAILGIYDGARDWGTFASIDGPILMMVFWLMGVLSIGIGSRWIDDEDREWWARAGAWVLLVIVGWLVAYVLVIYGPKVLIYALERFDQGSFLSSWQKSEQTLTQVVLFVGLISGFITILFAFSSKTRATVKPLEKEGRLNLAVNYAVKFAAPLFALFMIMVLSFLTDVLIFLIRSVPKIYNKPLSEWCLFPKLTDLVTISNASIWELLFLFSTLLLIGIFMARLININQFSLHSTYRNRLIRAYLGASNQRDPQPFTGFDTKDDLKMADLWPNKELQDDTKPPFHILNMTWNLVSGKNLAWQNRKAVSFTVSPLHCGNAQYGYRSSKYYGGDSDKLTLGTALTVSGAAASPNMGYHSSPAVAFLMTLFNVRLGWWLGNPTRNEYYRRSSPKFAVRPMFEEALGLTDDEKSYIYLSDGGHFENLGLYEMVLRRCHYIFVVDASRDPDYEFENLGGAIRSIRVDLGVPIENLDIFMYPRQANKPNAYCALGRIRYSKVNEGDANDGLLIYIKPVVAEGEPTDVLNYAHAGDFPHESTGDQFFSEQQFESYRMLGLHAIEQMFSPGWLENKESFTELKKQIAEFLDEFNKPKSNGQAPA